MIFLKIAFIVALCYIFSRGLTSDYEKKLQAKDDDIKVIRSNFKEYEQLVEAERDGLIRTINELREELQILKELKK